MMSSRAYRTGFSLIELMIAIMILGLGMVMAATVFPVSLDMTRGTVQLNIAETAADVAVGTLSLRVPRAKNLEKLKPDTTERMVAVPNSAGIDGEDFEVSATDVQVLGEDPLNFPDYKSFDFNAQVGPPWSLRNLNGTPLASFLTEISFWESQYFGMNVGLPTFIVQNQTLLVDPTILGLASPVVDEVPVLNPDIGPSSMPSRARISLADRVYPPVDVYYTDPVTLQPMLRTPGQILEEVRNRRYVWTAIHFRDMEDQTHRTFFTRIVVLYRGNTFAHYPKQIQPTTPAMAMLPDEAAVGFDTLFPQPWLVAITSVTADGVVTCTARIARLLPVGSYFVLAQGNGSVLPGAYTKVTQNTWDKTATDDTPTTLRIAPKSFPVGGAWYVWIFPPALNSRTASGLQRYENTSPTVDVVPKKVVAG